MKRSMIAMVVLAMVSGSAMATSHTVALGVQADSIKGSDGISSGRMGGLNLSYDANNINDSAWGVTVSGSATGTDIKDGDQKVGTVDKVALLAGPNYAINKYVTVYGLVGAAHGTIKVDIDDVHAKETTNDFAYGAGVKVNVGAGFSVRAGYEGFKDVNGFNVGVGYTF